MFAIKTESLSKSYKDIKAVRSLDISVSEGEFFSLLGVNGAGKTTTVKMLTTLVRPTSGDAYIFGNSIKTATECVKPLIGVSPQETSVATGLSVYENLSLMCGAYGLSREKREEKIAELSESLGLIPVLKRRAGKLSGGYQRRVSIAMALVGEPRLLFLDEPTLGLDVIARSELWDVLRILKSKTTILMTTHYMEEAEALSDRVGIMKDGELLFVGSPDEAKELSGCESFEGAFIKIVKEGGVK